MGGFPFHGNDVDLLIGIAMVLMVFVVIYISRAV